MTGPKKGHVPNSTATAGGAACCACRCHGEKTSSPVQGYLHSMVEIGLLKILLDHEVLDSIPEGADGIALDELATDMGAEPRLLGRFADFLIASRFLSSPSPTLQQQQQQQQQRQDCTQQRRVTHTALSRSIARDPEARLLFSLAFDFLLVPATEWSEFFDAHGLAEPRGSFSSSSPSPPPSDDNSEAAGTKTGGRTPFALAAGHPRSSPRSILDTMPERAASLRRVIDAAFHGGGGAGSGGIGGVPEALYDFGWVGEYAASGGGSGGGRTLVVDVSGDGQALSAILAAEPRIPATRCVVQDRAGDKRESGGKGGPGQVKRMVADMLEEQPIKGALLYHLGTALRWCGDDAEATRVLGRLRAACAADSRVLAIAEKASSRPDLDAATADIWMLNFGGRARSERELAALAADAGFRVSSTVSVSGGSSSAVLVGEVNGSNADGSVVVVEMVPV